MGEAIRHQAIDPIWGNGKKSRTPDNRETLYQSYLEFCSKRGIDPNSFESFVSGLTAACLESGIPIELDRDETASV